MTTKLLFIVPYPFDRAPSQRLKFEQYYNALENSGFEISYASFINESLWKIIFKKGHFINKVLLTTYGYLKRISLLFTIRKYHIVYIHLWITPFGPPFMEMLFGKLARKVVYDIDDLIYKKDISPNNKFVRFLKSSSKVNYLMRHAGHVLVSTDKLLEYALKLNKHVSLIPATIDVNKYNLDPKIKSDTIVIGWSGSHTTSKYLHVLDGVLKSISKKYDVKINVLGDKNFVIDGLSINLIEWKSSTEINAIKEFDIGLHPIPDEEWVYGKSGGKLVQYMAAGIPIVASAVGPNFKAVEDGYNGFLVYNEAEWIAKLELLITDEKLRKQMGKNSRSQAELMYSIEANLGKYLSVLSSN